MLTSKAFGTHTSDLCDSIASMTKRLCTDRSCHEDNSLDALFACRLIPLDKNPGLRPIGIGEILRRIIGKSVMYILKPDIIVSCGDLQLCAGQKSGCEAAVHSMASIFDEVDTDAILLIDASNAFNNLNRKVMLHNIKITCPLIATFAINSYRNPARLFVTGGCEIASSEGTTQGDPTSMAIYALSSLPLLSAISSADVRHVAYADDLSGAGDLESLKIWWSKLLQHGPNMGYYPNASKSWLVVKPEHLQKAKQIFEGTNVNITTNGKKHLGATIGSEEYKAEYIQAKVEEWVKELNVLCDIAKTHPHSAYCAFTYSFRHKFNYIMRTIPDIKHILQPIEDVIRHKFIPTLCDNRACNDDERLLFSLPVRYGGLGIIDITAISDIEYNISNELTKELQSKILHQNIHFDQQTIESNISKKWKTIKENKMKESLKLLRSKMTPTKLKSNDIAQCEGASSWLTTLSLKEEDFALNKREFIDALYIRYGWDVPRLPSICACSKNNSVEHSLSCKL